MPKVCKNGSDCKFTKMTKGCKFTHVPTVLPVVPKDPYGSAIRECLITSGGEDPYGSAIRECLITSGGEDRNTLGAQVYAEIVSALNQANCTQECHTNNVGGRMTGLFLDRFSLEELSDLLTKPTEFAEYMMSAFENYEANDKTTYIEQ